MTDKYKTSNSIILTEKKNETLNNNKKIFNTFNEYFTNIAKGLNRRESPGNINFENEESCKKISKKNFGNKNFSLKLFPRKILFVIGCYKMLLFVIRESTQVTFHHRCINSLMIEVYKHMKGHSPDIMNDIFMLRENVYDLQNFHIFQTEYPRSLKYALKIVHVDLAKYLFKMSGIFD